MSKAKNAKTLLDLIMAGKAPIPKDLGPIRAYHGSPAKFDRFDPKMPGKGGSMHGVGHYFSGDPAIAGGYRPISGEEGQMIRIKVGDKVVEVPRMDYTPDHTLPPDEYALDTIRSQLVEDAMVDERTLRALPTEDFPQFLNDRIDTAMFDAHQAGDTNHIQRLQQVRDELNLPGGAELEFSPMQGTMSEVDLNVRRDQLLRLNEGQSDEVMDKLTSMDLPKDAKNYLDRQGRGVKGSPLMMQAHDDFMPPLPPNTKGVDKDIHFMSTIADREVGASRNVAEALQQAGIPGSTYLDDTLMASANTPSRNYVMFPGSEDLIKKLRTYGVGGAAAGAGLAGSNQEAEAASPTSMRSLMNLISSSPTGRSLTVLPPRAFNTPRGQNLLQGLSPEQIEELTKQGGGYFDITDPKSPTLLPNFSNFDRAAISTQGRFPEFRADLPGTVSDLPRDITSRVPRGTGKQIYTNLQRPSTGIKIDGARPDNSVISTLAGNNHYYSDLLDINAPGMLDTFGIRSPGMGQPVNKPMAQGELYGGNVVADFTSSTGKPHPFYDRLGIVPPGSDPPEGMERLAGVPAPVMFAAGDGKKGNIVEAAVNNVSKVTDPIDRSTALVEELQDKVQKPVSGESGGNQYGEQEAIYRDNVYNFISSTPLSDAYIERAAIALQTKHGDEAVSQIFTHFVNKFSEDGESLQSLPLEASVLLNNAINQEQGAFDLGGAIQLTQEGKDNLSPEYLGVVGHISKEHFDGDYSLPSFRTEEEANAIAERTGENPDYYMNDSAYKNHQYLRGVDLASAGDKDTFYAAPSEDFPLGSSRPQFMRDAPRAVGFGGMSNIVPAQIPIADANEPEARFGYANELYERSNIPSTLNPDHRSIYDLKGRPRFNRYATDNVGNIIDSAYGSQRNMNSYGRLTSGAESAFRPLEISRIAQETGMPVDRIREINAFLRKSQDRGPTGRMPEGVTQEEYAKMIREFNAGQDQSDAEFGQDFANKISDGTHAVLNKNPLIEFTTGEPFDLGDKKDMRIAATGFQKSVPKAVEGMGADPATYAFAGLGGLAGGATKGATLGARLGKIGEGAAIGAFGSEDVIFEGGIPAIGGALTEGTTYFTGDASAIDPVTGVKPSDPSYEQKRKENERDRTSAQGKQYGVLDDLLPKKEKKKDTVLNPRTKAGGFQVPAFI